MPLFMDIHGHIEGLPADALAHARATQLKTPSQCDVAYLRGWFAGTTGKVFSLIDMPNKDATIAVHRDA